MFQLVQRKTNRARVLSITTNGVGPERHLCYATSIVYCVFCYDFFFGFVLF